jgi:hypothetical protein
VKKLWEATVSPYVTKHTIWIMCLETPGFCDALVD